MSSIQVDSITESTTNAGVTMNVPLTHKSYTTTEMNALTGMGAGDTIYNSTEGTLYVYNGSSWNGMSGGTFNFSVDLLRQVVVHLVVLQHGGGGGAGGYRNSYASEHLVEVLVLKMY